MSHPALPIRLLLEMLDQAFDLKAWHGPNLRGAIRRVSAAQAVWRFNPRRHSIAEIVVHSAYWKYAIRRKLRGDARGSFAFKGSNWFPQRDHLDEAEWKRLVALLVDEHAALRAAVAAIDPQLLEKKPESSKYTRAFLIEGAAAHDLYHAGQIQVLKHMQGK